MRIETYAFFESAGCWWEKGRFNTSRDYLVKVMRQKIEKEKSSLHIIKQEEKVVSVDKIAKHLVKRLNEI